MPHPNDFRHQIYSPPTIESSAMLLAVENWPVPREREVQQVEAIRRRFRHSGVDAIYLVHGTFVGEDASGALRELERVSPDFAKTLRRRSRSLLDGFLHEAGNYSESFGAQLAELIREEGHKEERATPVRRFAWSSENNHLGRAEAAIRLLAELLDASEAGESHFLLWGHSHAGNVFALLTNLLGSAPQAIERFFETTQPFCDQMASSGMEQHCWSRVREELQKRTLLKNCQLDIVTFGTPVRYGWDTAGYRRLLHVIHHRPMPDLLRDRAPFPFTPDDLRCARGGDYIQQLGIAGSDFVPFLFSYRNWMVERRLTCLLEADLKHIGKAERFTWGVRVPDEGTTFLVDYPLDDSRLREHLLGHSIYTRPEYLLFHADLVTQSFYGFA